MSDSQTTLPPSAAASSKRRRSNLPPRSLFLIGRERLTQGSTDDALPIEAEAMGE